MKKRKRRRVFISGPVTGRELEATPDFFEAKFELSQAGCDPINPIILSGGMPKDATHEEYMKITMDMLDMADEIYMLDGWENSEGAKAERRHAISKGMVVRYQGKEQRDDYGIQRAYERDPFTDVPDEEQVPF
jgi:hypothetical protein